MPDLPHRSASDSARWREIVLLRRKLGSLKAQTRLLRHELARKYNPDQPRVPAGSAGGGQWSSGGGGGDPTLTGTDWLGDLGNAPSTALSFSDVVADTSGDESWAFFQDATRPDGSLAERAVVNRDGSTIQSEFAQPGRQSDWDERHTVTLPEGGKTTFETSDRTQTIRAGGPDGEIVSRSTWTERGPERDATVQQAFAPLVLAPAAAEITITTALTLFTWLSARNKIDGLQAVAGFGAREFQEGAGGSPRLDFVANLTEQEADRACNRRSTVQELLDDAARDAGSPNNYPNAGAYGSAVHTRVKRGVDLKNDPDFRAEISAFREEIAGDGARRYGLKYTHRADVVERASETTACGYDLKTGNAIISPKRAAELVALMKTALSERSTVHHHADEATQMTTARQIRQLFAPLLAENPDIVLRKNYIYLKPVSHVHRCIGVGRSSGRDAFIVTAAVNFTFNLSGVIWEWPLGIRGYGWRWSDPAMPGLFKRLAEQELTQLRALTTLEAFARFASRDMTFMTSPLYGHKDCQLRVDIALGNLDKALADCRELDRLRGPAPHTEYFAQLWSRVVDPALPLLERRDVAGLISLLHEWQATYIEVTGLGLSFEPTPFLLELAAEGDLSSASSSPSRPDRP